MTIPSFEQILSLAPDDSAARAAKDLATTRKWSRLGFNEVATWGECQGSGADPYRTQIDIQQNAFKCTCPSRKFPCKHGLALFLLLAKERDAFTSTEAPEWVLTWFAQRHAREGKQKRSDQDDERATPPAPVAQAKRASKRQANVKAGLEDFDRWLQDLVRRGLASTQNESYVFWENQAKHLVDAQAPGIARLVRECAGTPASGNGWQERLMRQISQIYLLLEANSRLETLPGELQDDVRTAVGFTQSQEELLAEPGVADTWATVGQTIEYGERFRVQRTWLYGKRAERHAILLSFAAGTAQLDTNFLPGSEYDAELVFFPSAAPLRALLKIKTGQPSVMSEMPGFSSFEPALDYYSKVISKNPWSERVPMAINDVQPKISHDGTFIVRDSERCEAELGGSDLLAWQMIAVSGGRPVTAFGEWDGEIFHPISLFAEGGFQRLERRG